MANTLTALLKTSGWATDAGLVKAAWATFGPRVPAPVTVTVNATPNVPVGARFGSVQTSSPPISVPGGVAPTSAVPAGIVSHTDTAYAVLAPALRATSV